MPVIPHSLWIAAVPRLLAAAYLTALVAAVLIRVSFRPRRSHLSYRSTRQGRHALSRHK